MQSLFPRRAAKPQGIVPNSVIAACAAAVDELAKMRVLVEALEKENRSVRERLETEKRMTSLMQELINTQRQEGDALRAALSSKNEAIVAKNKVIDAQGALIEALTKRKTSPWKRLGDVLIGVAVMGLIK